MYNLERFVEAQKSTHLQAVAELSAGHKHSHWMWYTFPQFVGLGKSSTSYEYAIKSLDEARAYLEVEILHNNIYELCKILLASDKKAFDIFGSPDYLKLKSCMTLFDMVCPGDIFEKVLDKFYKGGRCKKTIRLINKT